MHLKPIFAIFALGLALLLSSSSALASDVVDAPDTAPSLTGNPEERAGRFELGLRMGGGAPYHLRSSDPNSKMVVSLAFGGSLGVRAAKSFSFAIEPTMLLQSTVASTTMGISGPPGTKPPAGTPSAIGVLSPTLGLHPSRYLALTMGPSLGGGAGVMGGGTARVALQLPVGSNGVRLAPAVETWALAGSGVSIGTLAATFGVEL